MITDYASLKAAIANWLARADLTSAIPEFIQLAESRINRSVFVRGRLAEVTGASANGEIPLPDDLSRIASLRVACGDGMRAIHPMPEDSNPDRVGRPVAYTVNATSIRLFGTDDTDYALSYYARIPQLSDSNTQNWLLTSEPGLYLYGALIEASPYLKNDDRTVLWAQQFRAALDDLAMNDEKTRFGNAPAMSVGFHAP